MFMRRRRPLMRAAMVGGAGYAVGKHAQAGRDQDAEQEQRIESLEAQQQTGAAPASGGLSPEAIDQLKELGQLKDQGVLTEAEFETQKQSILGSG
jgi:putative oligomerization/nucleic acid binding protein